MMLVDDEPPARRSLRQLLAAHDDIEVVAEAASVGQALALMAEVAPHVLFLDVELLDGRGFDVIRAAEHRPELRPLHIVFVTGYSRYAIEAFDVEAMDFLLKPVEPDRLTLTLDRLRRRIGPAPVPDEPAPARARSAPERLLVTLSGQSLYLPLDAIISVLAEGDYSRITIGSGQSYLICRLLGQFAAELPSPPFLRLSRSVIVNIGSIARVVWRDGGRARLHFNDTAPSLELGRAGTRRLRQLSATHAGLGEAPTLHMG
ncbi:response regulator transcription factor [Ancylobacter oerskovii]|nr:response regulator transcription factor [Ancylobacter oerskovii]